MLTLSLLHPSMVAKGLSAKTLAPRVPHIPLEHIQDLMSTDHRRVREPWLWEAHALTRALGMDTICTLIGLPLHEIEQEEDPRGDLAIWRTGCLLPLSVACRLARRFGLPDPFYLQEIINIQGIAPIVGEAWAVIASGERLSAMGNWAACPWCIQPAGEPHLPTCVPNNLWGTRDVDVASTIVVGPQPERPGKRPHGGHRAPGLKGVRERLGVSKQNMADFLGFSMPHYHKVEQTGANLTFDAAKKLREKFGVHPGELYQTPHTPAPEGEPHPGFMIVPAALPPVPSV